jgi:flagellar L-ring protein FlgH
MRMLLAAVLAAGSLVAFAPGVQAQTGTTPAPDSLEQTAAFARASWVSDRLPLRVGDLITVVVDEQTAAREEVSQVANGERSLDARLKADIQSGTGSGQNTDVRIGSSLGSRSDDRGTARRSGDLTAVLSVRVTALLPNGLARIEGSRKVTVDGRLQAVALTGMVRAEDVSSMNTVISSRIADAVITYKGKKIGPRNGIVGRVLSMLWP